MAYPRKRILVAFAAVGFAAFVCNAQPARPPSPAESTAIARSARSFLADWYYAGAKAPSIRVEAIRVSTAEHDWALARVSAPAARGRRALAAITVLLWRATGSPGSAGPSGRPAPRRWVVVSPRLSIEYSWCGIVPVAVSRDLEPNLGC